MSERSQTTDLRFELFCFSSVLRQSNLSLLQFYVLMHVYYRKASTNVINDTNMANTFRELLDKGYLAKLNDRIYKVSTKGHEYLDELIGKVKYTIDYGDPGPDFTEIISLRQSKD